MTSCNPAERLKTPPEPLFIVLSGPSGAGKDSVLDGLKTRNLNFKHITTVTTRPMRPGEVDGLHYIFTSRDNFERMISNHELLEYAAVYGNWYGVPKQPVKDALAHGHDVVIKTDVQGARTLKNVVPNALFIFLVPPDVTDLHARLKGRNTETQSDLKLRLSKVDEELGQLDIFDYLVFNKRSEISLAIAEIENILRAEKCRVQQRKITIE